MRMSRVLGAAICVIFVVAQWGMAQRLHYEGYKLSYQQYDLLTRPGDHPVLRIQLNRYDRYCPVPSAVELASARKEVLPPPPISFADIIAWNRDRGDPICLTVMLLVVFALNLWLGDSFALGHYYENWTPLLYWLTNVQACQTTLLLFIVLKASKCRLKHFGEQPYFRI